MRQSMVWPTSQTLRRLVARIVQDEWSVVSESHDDCITSSFTINSARREVSEANFIRQSLDQCDADERGVFIKCPSLTLVTLKHSSIRSTGKELFTTATSMIQHRFVQG
ncbi:unnamed protein product [Cercospora beticola]|nr:unnamed protein product [Cercospora beticola]